MALTGDPWAARVCPSTLEPGDVVPGVGIVSEVLVYPEDELRWICRVTWDDGACTLYNRRAIRVQVERFAELRNTVNVCIVELSQELQEVS